MQRKPLAAVLVLAAVVGAVVAGAAAAYADTPHPSSTTNRGWDTPPRDAFTQLDR